MQRCSRGESLSMSRPNGGTLALNEDTSIGDLVVVEISEGANTQDSINVSRCWSGLDDCCVYR
eukprot:scaffold373183_cov19-Prasinocladus_malaysianus.AAC.1